MSIYSIDELAGRLGISRRTLFDHRLDLGSAGRAASAAKVAPVMARANSRADGRLSDKQVRDAATAFLTSELAAKLAPIERVSNENYLFVPGRTGDRQPLVPVQQTTVLGQTEMNYDVIQLTGEARNVSPGGLASLTRVGAVEDRKTQPVGHYGVMLDYDMFEVAQGQLLNRNVPGERNRAASMAMAEKMEREGGFGDNDRERPGFFNLGNAEIVDLPKSFGDPSLTYDEMFTQLCIMELVWKRSNGRRGVSGVCMPDTHRLNLLRLFKDNNGSDTNAWLFALEAFPWLSNIIEDDRLLTASPSGGPIWQMWSADSEELYYEHSPAPMMFGPFEPTPLTTMFIMLAQTGGVVNKRAERVCRFQMPPLS